MRLVEIYFANETGQFRKLTDTYGVLKPERHTLPVKFPYIFSKVGARSLKHKIFRSSVPVFGGEEGLKIELVTSFV